MRPADRPKKTPFVPWERTGGAFSRSAGHLKYCYSWRLRDGLSGRTDHACRPGDRSHHRDRTFLAQLALIQKGADMTQADHYRDQSLRAKRLARAVKDPEASQKLIEMAEEFRLYAERLEQSH